MRIEKVTQMRIVLNNVKKAEKSDDFLINRCTFVLVLTNTCFFGKCMLMI